MKLNEIFKYFKICYIMDIIFSIIKDKNMF